MKKLAKGVLVLIWLVGPLASRAEPTNVRDFSVECVEVYARAYQVPAELVEAVIEVESHWSPYAVSSKGAVGLMQLMPATAVRFGVRNRFDIQENIRGGVAYLAWLMQLFGGELRLAVASYLVGESQILRRGRAYSSPEVFAYVSRVAQLYRARRREAVARRVKPSVMERR